MLHYAIWIWYGKLLAGSDTRFPWGTSNKRVKTRVPMKTIKALLDRGADLHLQTESGHTILDGLLLNVTQFDGCARPLGVLMEALKVWLRVLQDLGFSVKDYIRRERCLHEGIIHDLGLGLTMQVCFNEDASPWIWRAFSGTEEREANQTKDVISECKIWPEWQRRYALAPPPPRKLPARFGLKASDIIVLNENVPTMRKQSSLGNISWQPVSIPDPGALSYVRVCRGVIRILGLWRKHPYEFSFYVLLITSLLGYSYFARFSLTGIFYISFNVLGEALD